MFELARRRNKSETRCLPSTVGNKTGRGVCSDLDEAKWSAPREGWLRQTSIFGPLLACIVPQLCLGTVYKSDKVACAKAVPQSMLNIQQDGLWWVKASSQVLELFYLPISM